MFRFQRIAISWMLMAAIWWSPALAQSPEPAGNGAFADAQFVPGDVTFYLHLTDAATLRKDLASKPLGAWIEQTISESTFGAAWAALAEASDLSRDTLFDAVLGRQCTLATRTDAAGTQWVVRTVVPKNTMDKLRRTWRLQRQMPRHGLAIAALPEQDLLIAEDADTVIFGSRSHPELFNAVIATLGQPMEQSLAELEGFAERMQSLAEFRCGLFLRHNDFVGGSSLIGFDLAGRSLRMRHAATFTSPPFERPVTKQTCTFTVLRNFEREQLLTVMEPTDIGSSRFETFAMQYVGEALTGADLQKAIGERRIYAFGEEEGRLRDVPEDILAPVPVVCIEIDPTAYSVEQLDQQLSRFAARLNEMNEGALLVEVPPVHAYRTGQCDRSIDVSDAVSDLTGGFPIMKTLTLNWDVTDGADGTWCVVAGSPEQLESVRRSLASSTQSSPPIIGMFDSVGTINGLRLGRHLNNWARQANVLAPPGQQDQLRQTVGLAAGFAGSTDRIRWQLSRPDSRQMRLDVEITLSNSPSASDRK